MQQIIGCDPEAKGMSSKADKRPIVFDDEIPGWSPFERFEADRTRSRFAQTESPPQNHGVDPS
jgi:hypothetical protein